ncbi:MAG: hypothetical protein Q9202_006151 [Teloschistes flavicans]
MASPAQEEHPDQAPSHRYDLRRWHPAWDAQNHHFERPTRFALRGEQLFHDLCEAIVRYIEDPTLTDAEEWLHVRVQYRDIVALATFGRFAAVMQQRENSAQEEGEGESLRLRRMVDTLARVLPGGAALDGLMEMVAQLEDYKVVWGGGLVAADERTYERLAGWCGRITASRDALYRRLYGVRRRSVMEE